MSDADKTAILPMWPVGSSTEYIAARIHIAKAERVLRDQVEQVAAARRLLPEGALLANYALQEGPSELSADEPVRTTHLAEVFGEHDTLFVYHLMFHPDEGDACPMCSMWVDGLHAVSHHLAQHTAFAVIGKGQLPKLRAWARRRGWHGLRILSSHGTTFNADMRAEIPDGTQRPMVSVFVKTGEQVRHYYTLPANFLDNTERGIDLLCPVWSVLDLLPAGRRDWYADNSYVAREDD